MNTVDPMKKLWVEIGGPVPAAFVHIEDSEAGHSIPSRKAAQRLVRLRHSGVIPLLGRSY
jgi:hypothetical protein